MINWLLMAIRWLVFVIFSFGVLHSIISIMAVATNENCNAYPKVGLLIKTLASKEMLKLSAEMAIKFLVLIAFIVAFFFLK